MAKQTTTRGRLNSSTAATAPKLALVKTTPPRGHNRVKVTEAIVDQFVAQAIADDDVGNAKKGTASQRMTAALMGQHEYWVSLGGNIPGWEGQSAKELADCFHDADVRKGYLEMFRKRFITPPAADMEADARVRLELANAAKKTLIDTSIKAAAILVKYGVTFADFDAVSGMFEVDPAILLPLNAVYRGVLSQHDAPSTIPLDLTGYSAVNTTIDAKGKRVDGAPIRVKASVNQLFAAEATKWIDPANGKVGRKPRTPPVKTLKQVLDYVGPAETCMLSGDYLVAALLAKFANATDKNAVLSSKGWIDIADLGMETDQVQSIKGFDKEKLDKQMRGANNKVA